MTSTAKCISPIDGGVYAERPCLSQGDALAAAARARAAQKEWRQTPLESRIELLIKVNDYIGQTRPRMVDELARQMGRPVRYGGEYGGFSDRILHMAKIAAAALADDVVEDGDNFYRAIKREPYGVALVIAPWNYPYMTAINTIAPAIIAGNTVLLKHAAQTIKVGEHLADAFAAANAPPDVFQNIVLDHDTTAALIEQRAVDFVNFTGSVAGGRAVERAAAGTFIPVSTELGGKDPAYVREDADLAAAAESLVDGAMYNAGQCCCGIERIYVHQSRYDEFVKKAVETAAALRLGNPLEQDTTLGPMAHARFAKAVRAQVAEAAADGAKLHLEPMPADDGGAYLSPQILTNVHHKMRVMREETFGPVAGIMSVRDDEEAVTLMNDCAYGLTAAVWTADAAAAENICARLESGTVFMNRCDYLDPALCWTGCKDTGRGAGLSNLAYAALTRPKSYHLKKSAS